MPPSFSYLSSLQKIQAIQHYPMQSQPHNITPETTIDENLWEKISSVGSSNKQRVNAWILLGVSLFLFTGLGAFNWNLSWVIILVVAIFIHELGHMLGMKLFRYTNIKMLFIPLIGGVAIGTSGKQDAFRIAMISILGPVLGLLSCYLAVALWLFYPQRFFIEYAWFSLFINAFNLLPILPLDGGHFMNETLFSRFPKAELVFNIVAVITLAYIAYLWSSWLMGILALFWMITIPLRYNIGNVAAKLRRKDAVAGGEITKEKASRICQELEAICPQYTQGAHAKNLAKYIHDIWEKINKKFLTVPMTIFMVLIYLTTTCIFTIGTGLFIRFITRQGLAG